MAIEFDLESDADITADHLHTFFVEAIEGDLGEDGTVFRPGMYVMSGRITEGADLTAELFGFEPLINATFRFANLSGHEERDHNTVVMVSAVLALAERYGGTGILLFNGEQAVLQWTPEGVVFDSEWEDWSELEAVRPLVSLHASRRLAQPLLP
jgi:hypothetical protein